jgi:radical SAM protein (TIGR01212 family)
MRWLEKPYHSLDYEMKKQFGCKVYRLALDGGCSCPNRDGKIGYGGCIFCSAGGSGDFAADRKLSVTQQILMQEMQIRSKRPVDSFIAYFQAYTGTYAPAEHLRSIFTEAVERPEVKVLSIATRPDCLPPVVLELLARLRERKPVWVELGLQTIHEDTARFIRRGYALEVFEKAVSDLRSIGIDVIVHLILGLPGEDHDRMLQSVRWLNDRDIQGVKLQLLHILRGTDLAAYYLAHPFPVMTQEAYTGLVIDCLEHLRSDIVIHRLTGDGPSELLIAPDWSRNKRSVLNGIHSAMKMQGAWQGRLVNES